MKFIKKFLNQSDYEQFIQSDDYLKPNVSYCNENIYYHPDGDIIHVSDAGMLAFVADYNLAVPKNIKTYIVTNIVNGSVKMSEIKSIPIGTPVIVQAEEGDYLFPYISKSNTDVSNNLLRVVQPEEAGTITNVYVLARKNGVTGFYTFTGAGLSAGKIYILPQ